MLDFDIEHLCYGCGACKTICPKNAIDMKKGYDGFLYPVIDKYKCVKCGLCDKVCQVLVSGSSEITLNHRKCFAIYNKDEKIRKTSSSGGLFSVLANKIIKDGGVVFGVIINDNKEVIHTYTESYEGLEPMRGSKYVQSEIGTAYIDVKRRLLKGQKVLFTGTPCQVNGLYKYLKERNDNLYTCDIVCHGVPSPLVFKKYINSVQNTENSEIERYYFRDKTSGWKRYSIKIKFKNNKEKITIFNEDIYMKGFLKDLYLRNSCYSCKCKGNNVLSDITTGDFWGIESKYPDYDDDKGLCAVLSNTSKGLNLLDSIKDKLFIKEVNVEDILIGNPCLIESVKNNRNRELFFKNLDKIDFISNIKRNIKDPILARVKNKSKTIIRKFIPR